MATAIIYYSRSGHSKRLAERLAREMNAELLEIVAPAYAGRLYGYARAGFDSLRQRKAGRPPPLPSLAEFDRIVLCGPVWTSYPAVPLRDLLRSGAIQPASVSLFLTSGAHSPASAAFDAAAADLGRSFAATASLPNSAENTAVEERLIAQFLADLEAVVVFKKAD
ncbi:MAG: flavodoxin family protein [Sulfitobacter sp.]